jgi:hypothetical protein
MKTSAEFAKSKGILAFANNSQGVDYELIANKTLQLASRTLGVPVHLVTGQRQEHWRNTRYDIDSKQNVIWNNFDRYHAWEQTPFDETIVIDVDYLIVTGQLKSLFGNSEDLVLCHRNEFLHRPTLPVTVVRPVWATVFYFRKTPRTKLFFDLVGRIQRNYEYYRILYGVTETRFRNDYAFAIAEIIFNGGNEAFHTRMPFGITSVDYSNPTIDIDKDWMIVRTDQSAEILPRQDLHVMSKAWLQSDQLDKFIQKAML